MKLSCVIRGKTYQFNSLREVMGKANEPKTGDLLAGVGAESTEERIAAKMVLSELMIKDLQENPAVPYENDCVTRIIQDDIDLTAYNTVKMWTISQLREWILDDKTNSDMILSISKGLTSEVIAGVCKIMSNLDLMYAANKIEVTSHCNTTLGRRGVFASRLQPNHPTDGTKGVMASLLDGLSYGIGDALFGLNPSIDTVESTSEVLKVFDEVKKRYEIPTQICVLSHVTTQMEAVKKGAPSDLCFQSIAGTQKAIESFGISDKILSDANQLMKEMGTGNGPNYMYFETGQGSELSSDAHYGWDQQTMESRCYGLARHYNPFLVNTVVGFIGPEYLYDGKQVIRAALEDNFCGHMHGLVMGCDCCYTNHMNADQNDNDNLIMLMGAANCAYVMGVPQGDDVMLMYQSTGYHDIAAVREVLGKEPVKEFKEWLYKMGIWEDNHLTDIAGDMRIFK